MKINELSRITDDVIEAARSASVDDGCGQVSVAAWTEGAPLRR